MKRLLLKYLLNTLNVVDIEISDIIVHVLLHITLPPSPISCPIKLSSCGDLFLEDWSYCSLSDAPPDEGEGRGRVVSMVIDSWCREVDEVEKMARMKEGKWRKRDVVRDWSKLMMCEWPSWVGGEHLLVTLRELNTAS